MKKTILLALLCPVIALAAANDMKLMQRKFDDQADLVRFVPFKTNDCMVRLNSATTLPDCVLLGPNMTLSGGVLDAVTTAGPQGPQGIQGTVGATGPQGPAGTPAQAFAFGDPVTRTLTASTAYQATDPTRSAVVTVSLQCTNATTVLAASACTMQIRQGPAGLNCSTGTVVSVWTSTYALGLVLTNTSGSPVDIKLPAGRYFALCPTAGTFTVLAAVDQTAG